ncbi:unnamed protein product [Cyclocybe aegerita]|uniref:FCP1 homology domain-containing protein n=1 Tax=Cyclocybe aegerita TaxID=1973307 RepID=A0A8S0W6L8_CYCAE|nr:unnamed protein product [Cyclocybe aegerita]
MSVDQHAPSPPPAQQAAPAPDNAPAQQTNGAPRPSVDNQQGQHPKTPTDNTHDASTLTQPPDTSMCSPKNPSSNASNHPQHRSSFLSKLIHFLVPCITPSNAHQIDIPDQPQPQPQQPPSEKPAAELEKSPPALQTPPDPSPPTDLPKPSIITDARPATPLADDAQLILPPTPTTQLLPAEETEGMTSGAVQPPGSKGDTPIHEKPHPSPTDTAVDENESEGSFTEDEDLDDQEEEDRLILNGGAGIPIGPDGVPKPLLPPISPQHAGRKCLVLDLDETLVHSSFKSISQADYVVPVEIEYHWHNVYVIKRPGVDNFLKKMGEIYEIVVFTASLSKYADPVLDKLDIHQVVSHRLFRESCYNHKGNYVKDLSQLGRPIADTIILDNSPASYIFHPNNAVPVSSWFNDPHDTELTDLVPFLADLSGVEDVRGVLDGAR